MCAIRVVFIYDNAAPSYCFVARLIFTNASFDWSNLHESILEC